MPSTLFAFIAASSVAIHLLVTAQLIQPRRACICGRNKSESLSSIHLTIAFQEPWEELRRTKETKKFKGISGFELPVQEPHGVISKTKNTQFMSIL